MRERWGRPELEPPMRLRSGAAMPPVHSAPREASQMADEKKGTASAWTKRDELAAMFMQGMLAGNALLEAGSSSGSLQNQNAAQQVALRAYRFADGFLAARTETAR